MKATIILITGIYMLAMVFIGVWATKRTKSSKEFFLAGKSLGMYVMAIAAFSSVLSGFGMVGGTSFTYSGGLGFTFGVMIAAPLGFGLAWFLVGKRMMKLGETQEVYTLGDVVEYRYNSKAVRGWLGLAIALGVVGYLGTQVQAMGIIMNTIFGVSPAVGAFIGLGVLAFYAIGGGMMAGIYTELVQGTIMVAVSIIAFFVAVNAGGGMLEITKTFQESAPLMASPLGNYAMLTVACWFFLFSLGAAGQPQMISKFLMLKDKTKLKWGSFTAGLAFAISTFLVIGIGLAAAALKIQGKFPEIATADLSLTTFLLNFTPPIVAGLVIAGVMSAIMSTGDSFLNLGAASIVRDIPKALGIEVKNELLWSRLAVAGLLIISLFFSFYMNTLVALLGTFGWGMFASAVFPSVVLGLVWPKATKSGAVMSIVTALALNSFLEIGAKYGLQILPKGVVVGAFSFGVAIIVFIVVSLLTQPREQLDYQLQEIIDG